MKKYRLILFIGLLFVVACTSTNDREENSKINKEMEHTITKAEAIEIANKDAAKVYEDLSQYQLDIKSINGNWEIDYMLKDTTLNGGGPFYVISQKDGEIIEKKYRQ